jgi:hypothetical protein
VVNQIRFSRTFFLCLLVVLFCGSMQLRLIADEATETVYYHSLFFGRPFVAKVIWDNSSSQTHNVPDFGLVINMRARLRGWVCCCGNK